MSKEASFDIVCKVNEAELENALNQAEKEIAQRYDLKDSGSEIKREKEKLLLSSASDMTVKAVLDSLVSKLVKRGVSLKFLEIGPVEDGPKGTKKQTLTLKQGISKENAKKIQELIKNAKIKVNAQFQDDQVRVSGKDKDDLQAVIALLRKTELDIDLQFTNYR